MSADAPIFRRNEPEVRKLLEFLMQEKGMTLLQIAREVGVSESVVSRWKGGVVPRGPTFEKLKKLTRENLPEISIPLSVLPMVRFPLLGSLPAGAPEDAREEKVGEMELPAIMLGGNWKDCYAIQLTGDSMEPEAYKGDWVLVRKNKRPEIGDWVIAKIDERWCVKKMGKKPGELESVNPKYPKLKASEELELVGVVIKVIHDPRRGN